MTLSTYKPLFLPSLSSLSVMGDASFLNGFIATLASGGRGVADQSTELRREKFLNDMSIHTSRVLLTHRVEAAGHAGVLQFHTEEANTSRLARRYMDTTGYEPLVLYGVRSRSA